MLCSTLLPLSFACASRFHRSERTFFKVSLVRPGLAVTAAVRGVCRRRTSCPSRSKNLTHSPHAVLRIRICACSSHCFCLYLRYPSPFPALRPPSPMSSPVGVDGAKPGRAGYVLPRLFRGPHPLPLPPAPHRRRLGGGPPRRPLRPPPVPPPPRRPPHSHRRPVGVGVAPRAGHCRRRLCEHARPDGCVRGGQPPDVSGALADGRGGGGAVTLWARDTPGGLCVGDGGCVCGEVGVVGSVYVWGRGQFVPDM